MTPSAPPELAWIVHRLVVAFIALTGTSWIGLATFRHRKKRDDERREQQADERRENSLKEMGFR